MNNSRAHRLKITIGIVGAAVLLVGIVLATILLLKSFTPKHDVQKVATIAPSLSAADTVKAYTKESAIAALSSAAYDRQSDASTGAYVFYKSKNQPYAVNVKATDHAWFSAKDQAQPDDSAAIQSQTEQLLKDKGFQKTSQPARVNPQTSSDMTFENTIAVCQLKSTPSSPHVAASYSFACIDKPAITAEYATLTKLLDLYKKSHSLDNFTEVNHTSVTEGNKSLAIVGLSKTAGYSSLLFAAIDNNWEYIATLNDGNSANSNGKYTPSPALNAAFSSPKYGDFLKKNVG